MTREEHIYEASKAYSEYEYNQTDYENGFINGAKWADKTMIEKACEWLLKGGYFVNNTETINDFKQAMEE